MKVLSLFSGVGGFDLGLEAAGMETVFQCEWDKHCQTILNRHWPTVPKWDDVSTLTAAHILTVAPVIDVVAWGSPCQDLSVAGKRAGLGGERSGLFHQGIRIIKEMRELTNGKYPRFSIWENVAGALSSNQGADFGQILYEMDEAGACFSEWRLLDAQYFGVPQRRRRVFVISVFDLATAERCPNPLLPVSEGVRWHPATSATTRKEPASETPTSIGSGRKVANTISASLYHHGTVVNQDVNNEHLVVDTPNHARPVGTPVLGSEICGPLAAVDYKWPQNQQLEEKKFIAVEPFVKSRRAQSTTDHETWVEAEVKPTINQFDAGDTRTTTAIVMRQREGKPGGGKGPLLSEDKSLTLAAAGNDQTLFVQPIGFSHTQGLSAQPSESAFPTLRTEGNGMAVAFDGYNQTISNVSQTIRADKSDGDHVGMVLQPTAVAYDEYNDALGGTVHHALRAGTKQSTGVLVDNEVVGTLRSGGDGGVPSSRGEHLVVAEAAGFKPGASANAHSIGYEEGVAPSLEAGGGGNNRPAVLEPTMSVRRLTPLECERLMGWPDDWTAGQSDTHRYKQCGNGVASPVAQWIAEQLINL